MRTRVKTSALRDLLVGVSSMRLAEWYGKTGKREGPQPLPVSGFCSGVTWGGRRSLQGPVAAGRNLALNGTTGRSVYAEGSLLPWLVVPHTSPVPISYVFSFLKSPPDII